MRFKAFRAALGVLVILTIPAGQSSVAAESGNGEGLANYEAFDAPRQLAPIAFKRDDGAVLSLEDFRGKVVVLNFWATWCGPCVREMPELDALQVKRGGGDFAVVAVSFDRQGVDVVRRFYDERGIANLPIYLDQKMSAARAIDVEGLPMTYVIGRDGRAVGRVLGAAEWASDAALALVDRLIEESADPDAPQQAAE